MLKKFLFIDRDGTLIREPKDNFQVDDIHKFFLEKHVISSLSVLIKYGYHLVMVTNQDGLGGPNFSIKKFSIIQDLLLNILASERIFFDAILICPHNLLDKCNCRKPNTGLVNFWINNTTVDTQNSYVIGDRDTDIKLADNMNIKSLLYDTHLLSWVEITNFLTKPNRYSEVFRSTNETKILVKLNLDNSINKYINTGIKFLDHMLDQLCVHSNINIFLDVKGDLDIDDHHVIEDIGITLGYALKKTLGSKVGLSRYGFTLPMDESIASCIIDLSGRSFLVFKVSFKYKFIGDLSACMIEHFFYSLSQAMGVTIHLYATGNNDHHCCESIFKAFGRSLRQAVTVIDNILPTSKGLL